MSSRSRHHALSAATVNGALGYGFSSLTVPVALFFLTNRVLNPALVPIEVVLNGYVLWVNRASVPHVWRRVMPIVIALAPGVVVGTMLVTLVNADWLKLITYVTLLPLILLQAAGFRRPIQSERAAGYAFGSGLGVLYSMTTISGPPLAVALSNQGLAKQEFRAALGVIRLAESSMTAVAYAYAGLYSRESFALIPAIIPSLDHRRAVWRAVDSTHPAGDVPTDLYELRCVGGGFRNLRLMRTLHLGTPTMAYAEFVTVVSFDLWLLYRFFFVYPRATNSNPLNPLNPLNP
jgi:uncharacterized membrane protein YfcA